MGPGPKWRKKKRMVMALDMSQRLTPCRIYKISWPAAQPRVFKSYLQNANYVLSYVTSTDLWALVWRFCRLSRPTSNNWSSMEAETASPSRVGLYCTAVRACNPGRVVSNRPQMALVEVLAVLWIVKQGGGWPLSFIYIQDKSSGDYC